MDRELHLIRRAGGRLVAVAGLILVAAGAASAAAPPADASRIDWRPYDAEAFREAAAAGRPVFLVLTAPWNRDHFRLVPESLDDPRVRDAIATGWIPVRADVSLRPALRDRHGLASGLVPSFHFLDAAGRSFASFPPMGAEELAFYLDVLRDPANRLPEAVETPSRGGPVAATAFADSAAARLAREAERKGALVAGPARDLDPTPLRFLLEWCLEREAADVEALALRRVRELVTGPLHDPVDGGFFRAPADPRGREVQHEKTLASNAAAIETLAAWYRRTGDVDLGRATLSAIRFANERLRTGTGPRYAASLAADVWTTDQREIVVAGETWYRLDEVGRAASGPPPRADAVPVGANLALLRALLVADRAFLDPRLAEAIADAAGPLLAEGFRADGRARAALGSPEPADLGGQADAGLGLLAVHASTGRADALEAAVRLAGALLAPGGGDPDGRLRDLRPEDGPPAAAAAPSDAGRNGRALRFLVELGETTGDARWTDAARRGLAAWADTPPVDPVGLGELGLAALRLDAGRPVACLLVDPAREEPAAALRAAVLRITDRLTAVRWIDPNRPQDVAWVSGRGVDAGAEAAPAIVLLGPDGTWTSAPTRDPAALRQVWRAARRRRE